MIQFDQVLILVVILALIATEAAVSAIQSSRRFNLKDTWVNILIGVCSIAITIANRGIVLIFFYFVFSKAFFEWTHSIAYWVALFLLTDLIAYGFHYIGHKSRFFWASHVIHHSSEQYNLSTAVRVPVTNFFYRFLFYAPLCLIGFDPLHVVAMESAVYLYNFYLHTESIRTLGWLEYIFNTPSHHRVHHACDEKYIDKNFGSVLIIWDRLFGTFQKEEEAPRYGITKPIKSHNFFRIISHEWIDIARDLRKCYGIKSIWKTLFGAP